MPRSCDSCGTRYEPLRKTSRYCSGRCRTRAHRSGDARPAKNPGAAVTSTAAPGTLELAVLEELTAAKKDATALGRSCVALARRIDTGETESGSALAALNRELRASLQDALKVAAASDALDEMARKRAERLRRTEG